MGKTNCPEFSYGIRGDVGAFGAAVNPYDPEKVTGGSSSGSAVAVAAGIVPIALGTDTAGSVRVPAALCGVVGFKPTTGSLPDSGIFPLAPSFDTAGILCGSMADAELVWNALRSPSSTHFQAPCHDPSVADEKVITVGALADASTLTGSAEVLDAFSRAVSVLEAVGQEIDRVSLKSEYDVAKIYNDIRAAEAYVVHKDLLAKAQEAYQPETLERIRAGKTLTYSQVANSRDEMQKVRSVFLDRFRNFDIFITPTVPILAPDAADAHPSIGPLLLSLTVIWNVLGWPAVSIPVHVAGCNLPQSVQLVAKPGMEGILFMMAKRLEKCLAKEA
jgi:aspartyl-tRNA(Asn)/glutamyl-tRNA(Gln) amidotransferase subunit A